MKSLVASEKVAPGSRGCPGEQDFLDPRTRRSGGVPAEGEPADLWEAAIALLGTAHTVFERSPQIGSREPQHYRVIGEGQHLLHVSLPYRTSPEHAVPADTSPVLNRDVAGPPDPECISDQIPSPGLFTTDHGAARIERRGGLTDNGLEFG